MRNTLKATTSPTLLISRNTCLIKQLFILLFYPVSLSRDVGALFDNSVDLRLGMHFEDSYKWASLKKKFSKATALEIDFWKMALR